MENEELISKLFVTSQKISKVLMEKLDAKGMKWIVNTGREAGQEVFHTHVHLIPYYDNKNTIITSKKSIEDLYKNYCGISLRI